MKCYDVMPFDVPGVHVVRRAYAWQKAVVEVRYFVKKRVHQDQDHGLVMKVDVRKLLRRD
jgi:hypothetical protein